MESPRQSHPPYGAAIGLATGMIVGAGLAIWLVPRFGSELPERIIDSAKSLGRRASNRYARASNRFGQAVEALTSPRAR